MKWTSAFRRCAVTTLVTAVGLLLLLPAGFRGLDRAFPPDLARAQDLSRQVLDREGRLLRLYLTKGDYLRLPARPDEVDPAYLEMLIAYEDKRFRSHGGIDWLAMLRAAWQAAVQGRVISGASTLTMQVARLLEPRERTVAAKLIEMFRAVQLEERHSKDEILSLYLTLAPYGGNLEGIRAACLHYFGRPPRDLTPGERALLVALPQAPERLRPDRHPEAAREGRNKVLRRMVISGLMSPEEAARAADEAISRAAEPRHFAAPHLADRLVAEMRVETSVASTLDAGLQQSLAPLLKQEAQALGPSINAALIVVRNDTREVLAYLGSSDFTDEARRGQIDLARALRSPGSTLKPAIYAFAFERGIAHPKTLVDDVPTRFGDYAPANFMDRHHGRISLAEALRLSLNVPAVALLDRIGPVAFTERLRRDGMVLRFAAADTVPGLAVALGGVGTTLEDLVRLYAALADDGRLRSLRFRIGEEGEGDMPEPFVGARARRFIARILGTSGGIVIKTGTSYGFRDAWAIGYNPHYTVGVWVGRPDGTPLPGRFGANTAMPILVKAFGRLPDVRDDFAFAKVSVTVGEGEPPPALRYLGDVGMPRPPVAKGPPPRILFPPDGVALPLPPGEGLLALEAEGGLRPLSWIINGEPLPARTAHRRARFRPDGIGFTEILLIDATGRRAKARVRLMEAAFWQ